MSLKPTDIAAAAIVSQELEDIVNSQLRVIDECICSARPKLGMNCIEYKIPSSINPSIRTSTDSREVQTAVYAAIIMSLEKRGFDSRINLDGPDKNKHRLYIRWNATLSDKQRRENFKILNEHLLENSQIAAYVVGADIVAKNNGSGDSKKE